MMQSLAYNIIIYFSEMLISFAFFTRIYEKKFKNTVIVLIGSILFIASAFIFKIFNNEIINLFVFLIINIVFSNRCFKIDIKNSFIFSLLLDAIMYASELIVIFFTSSIFNLPTKQYRINMLTYVVLSATSKLLYLALSQLLVIIVRHGSSSKGANKQFLPLFIFPALIIAFSTVLLLLSIKTILSSSVQMIISILIAAGILACIFIFIYYQNLEEKTTKLNELEIEAQYYEINNNYLELLEHQNNELQLVLHDTKHHYMDIENMDNIISIRNYISKIYESLDEHNMIVFSNNKMLDVLLNKYKVLCEKENVNLFCEVRTANLNYINDFELSAIINNILDNALYAAKRSKEKAIELSIRHINNMDLLSVINSCDDKPTIKNNHLITTKTDSKSHGYGMKIIENNVSKNGGTLEWSYNEFERKFHTNIFFKSK